MEPHKDLKTLLDEALELKNVSHDKLAQATGIPERYIWALHNMEIDKLPAAPYVRGYIKKISEILHLNHDELWELYKKALEHKQSGVYDTLPINRFAIKRLSKKIIIGGVIGAAVLIYILINISRLTGLPKLIVTNPAFDISTTSENIIRLTGYLEQRDKLLVNEEEIFIASDGTFNKEYDLQPGLNTIEFKAQRFLGREVTEIKQVMYQPGEEIIMPNNKTIN
ncbi:MAG: hypothetical protein A3H63_01085 [Candidatus Harrisonbacteria bacterium RIFCSPLOWO2_02_FULL_45_10c]|uniref:HTH cro/C1-type domain-containing protein n=1 Tax=Candidatus Harrisonbacteria bacterium RIFCSPLOWO2_02_FULL_45_10c TaxID=1798410 RepID=A0A1G1ZSM0_9BACT|nr:MAG: hypothetical protein A3H63_01085 [Candidatus Harrisonbacteria bacterium RIFCSPLOWO2_02_FULL_45_10c]